MDVKRRREVVWRAGAVTGVGFFQADLPVRGCLVPVLVANLHTGFTDALPSYSRVRGIGVPCRLCSVVNQRVHMTLLDGRHLVVPISGYVTRVGGGVAG